MRQGAGDRDEKPVDHNRLTRFLQPGNLRSAHSGFSALELNETKINNIRILLTDAEHDGIYYAGAWSARCALEESHTPAVLRAVHLQRFFTCGFGCAGLCECAHT